MQNVLIFGPGGIILIDVVPLEGEPRRSSTDRPSQDLPALCDSSQGLSRDLPPLHGEHGSYPDCSGPVLLHLQVHGLVAHRQLDGDHHH